MIVAAPAVAQQETPQEARAADLTRKPKKKVSPVYPDVARRMSITGTVRLADATDKIRFQMMQNRLYLTNYLLSGDSRESDHVNDGIHSFVDRMQVAVALSTSEQQRAALAKVQQTEQNWARDFAEPLMQKR